MYTIVQHCQSCFQAFLLRAVESCAPDSHSVRSLLVYRYNIRKVTPALADVQRMSAWSFALRNAHQRSRLPRTLYDRLPSVCSRYQTALVVSPHTHPAQGRYRYRGRYPDRTKAICSKALNPGSSGAILSRYKHLRTCGPMSSVALPSLTSRSLHPSAPDPLPEYGPAGAHDRPSHAHAQVNRTR